jgi:hypothetical protein
MYLVYFVVFNDKICKMRTASPAFVYFLSSIRLHFGITTIKDRLKI